jgi:tripartite-type tricarboxylate transporter receptor subunit TctC
MQRGRRKALQFSLLPAFWPLHALAQAQGTAAYPSKQVTLVVGFAPGGSVDFVGREIAPRLAEALGKPVVVENRGGANGLLAAVAVAAAAPDGHTLLVSSMGLTTNPHLYSKNRLDPNKDFTAISMLVTLPNVLVVNPQLPVRSFEEFLAFASTRPRPLTSATTGTAAPGHLASEQLKRATKVNFEFISYKGSGPALTDVIAGHVDMSMPTVLAAAPLVKAGRLRAIAVTGARRSPLLPDVPTLAEKGVKELETGSGWIGLFGPANMPRPIADRLSAEAVALMKNPQMHQRLIDNGTDPVALNAADTAAFVAQDYKRWGELVQAAGIKGEE